MGPAVPFPREDEPLAGAPEELVCGDDRPKRASGALVGAPHLASLSGGDVGDPDRPGKRPPPRRERERSPLVRDSDEREAVPVGRPDGRGVPIEAWVQIAKAPRFEVEASHEGVIASSADEGEPASVRRPAKRAGAPADLEQPLGLRAAGRSFTRGLRFTCRLLFTRGSRLVLGSRLALGSRVTRRRQLGRPDLVLAKERDPVAARGHGRGAADGQPSRPAGRRSLYLHDPDGLLRPVGGAPRVGGLALSVRPAAPHEEDPIAVGSEREARQILAVVLLVGGELPAPELRGPGDPYVAHALRVLDPGHGVPGGRRHEARREGRGEDPIEAERLLGRRRREPERGGDRRRGEVRRSQDRVAAGVESHDQTSFLVSQ